MPVYKDEKNGSWYAMVRFEDWTGQCKQKCKRGFSTRREALEWERTFQQQSAGDPDMTFEAFCKLYEKDMRPRLKESTWATKDHITRTKTPSLLREAPSLRTQYQGYHRLAKHFVSLSR